ncbi:tRNA-splicing endonuclease subunit SEN54-like [Miscanthus floridulus]|uniref:tRNA-splicing endonuclease subunit SEN54-like n=1 Tax=Miscanthus floridulus TaxID=154761 RepID=UPI00345A1BA3
MAAAAASARDRRRRSRAPAGGAAHAVGIDDGEEQHLNPFLDAAPSASSRVQFRNMASCARWVEETGAAEVVESRGNLWLTTGVTRAGKLYYNIEEIGFLAERGALILLNDKDETIGIDGIYEKLAGGNYGCSWDTFQAYKHLKSLGYIVGRFGVPWTMKHGGTCDTIAPQMNILETDQSLNRVDGVSNDITKLLKKMQIDGISPSFEVYLPNSKFKKSSPGSPCFLLCLLRGKPPSRVELEAVENNFRGIPLKYCHVDNGRVSFLSFDEVTLPSLP